MPPTSKLFFVVSQRAVSFAFALTILVVEVTSVELNLKGLVSHLHAKVMVDSSGDTFVLDHYTFACSTIRPLLNC